MGIEYTVDELLDEVSSLKLRLHESELREGASERMASLLGDECAAWKDWGERMKGILHSMHGAIKAADELSTEAAATVKIINDDPASMLASEMQAESLLAAKCRYSEARSAVKL